MENNTQPGTVGKAIENLLSKLCVDLGFCIPQKEIDKLVNADYLDADEFACTVTNLRDTSFDSIVRRVI